MTDKEASGEREALTEDQVNEAVRAYVQDGKRGCGLHEAMKCAIAAAQAVAPSNAPAAWNKGGVTKDGGYYWLLYPEQNEPKIGERHPGYIFDDETLWFGPLSPPDEDAAPSQPTSEEQKT